MAGFLVLLLEQLGEPPERSKSAELTVMPGSDLANSICKRRSVAGLTCSQF